MAKTTVKLYKNFDVITDEIKDKARVGLARAADTCLHTIQSEWPNGANMFHTERVEATLDGFKSGVSAEHKKKHIAHFHDHGTLGHFRRGTRTTPKRPRAADYKPVRVRASSGGPVGEPTGIKAKRFYGKGRAAGKRALLRSLGL